MYKFKAEHSASKKYFQNWFTDLHSSSVLVKVEHSVGLLSKLDKIGDLRFHLLEIILHLTNLLSLLGTFRVDVFKFLSLGARFRDLRAGSLRAHQSSGWGVGSVSKVRRLLGNFLTSHHVSLLKVFFADFSSILLDFEHTGSASHRRGSWLLLGLLKVTSFESLDIIIVSAELLGNLLEFWVNIVDGLAVVNLGNLAVGELKLLGLNIFLSESMGNFFPILIVAIIIFSQNLHFSLEGMNIFGVELLMGGIATLELGLLLTDGLFALLHHRLGEGRGLICEDFGIFTWGIFLGGVHWLCLQRFIKIKFLFLGRLIRIIFIMARTIVHVEEILRLLIRWAIWREMLVIVVSWVGINHWGWGILEWVHHLMIIVVVIVIVWEIFRSKVKVIDVRIIGHCLDSKEFEVIVFVFVVINVSMYKPINVLLCRKCWAK